MIQRYIVIIMTTKDMVAENMSVENITAKNMTAKGMITKKMTVENITGKLISVVVDVAEMAADVIEQKIKSSNRK